MYRLRGRRGLKEGEELFRALCGVVEREKPDWAGKLLDKATRYMAFLQYPEEVCKHIYTTNVVEPVNAGIEQMRLELGGYFPFQRCLEVNLFIQVVNLQDRWWRHPLPTVRDASYRLRRLFALKYELVGDHEPVRNFWGSLDARSFAVPAPDPKSPEPTSPQPGWPGR